MSNARFCIIPARALGDKRLNRTDIMVLNALGMFGDKAGWSFPSTSTIADMIQAHRVSVSKALSSLSEYGYIESRMRYRPDGGQTSNEYRILFDAPGESPAEILGDTPVADALPPCNETATPPVVAGTTLPVAEPLHHIKEPTLTPQVNAACDDTRKAALPDFAIVYQKVLAILKSPTPYAGSPVHQWLAWGAIPEVDIYPTIEAMNARREHPPNTLKFFNQAIADAIHGRKQPIPKARNNAKPSQSYGKGDRSNKTDRLIAAARRAHTGEGFAFDAMPQSPGRIDVDADAMLPSAETVR